MPSLVIYLLLQSSMLCGESDSLLCIQILKGPGMRRIFGGAKLDLISRGDQKLTFKDIEGIDQVKGEIRELVEFLKNPKKFIDLGARSPAGVLLVGAPGTGGAFLQKAATSLSLNLSLHHPASKALELLKNPKKFIDMALLCIFPGGRTRNR